MTESFDRHVYVIMGVVDVAKVMEEAEQRLARAIDPQTTLIHYHRHGTPCEGFKHNAFR